MLTQQEKKVFLNQVEISHSPQLWNLYGLDVWPLIRKQVLFLSYDKVKTTTFSPLQILRLDKILRQLRNTLSLLFRKSEAKYLVVSSDSKRKEGQENSFVSFLLEELKIDERDIELLEYNKKKDLTVPDTKYKVFHLQYFFEIFARLSRPGAQAEKLESFEQVESIAASCDRSLLKVFNQKKVTRVVKKMRAYSDLFSRTLKNRTSLKAILMEQYYTEYNMALVNAARLAGKPVVEFQHGVQNALHLTYGSFENVPAKGFNTVPDIFWVWTNYEQSLLNKWMDATECHRTYVGGFTTVSKAENPEPKPKAKKSILFTLQPIGKPISTKLAEAINCTWQKYDWLFRFHPNQLQNKSEINLLLKDFDLADKVEYKTSSSNSLGAVLSNVDLHITMSSSCIIEAAVLGVPTIIVGEKGWEYYNDRLEDLQAQYILDITPSDIKNAMGRKVSSALHIGSLEEALQHIEK